MAVRAIEYIELYVADRAAIVDYFASSFGFTSAAESVDGNSSLLRQGKVKLIITAGSQTREFISAHGDGVADIAFACDDVAATLEAATAAGAVMVGTSGDLPALSGLGDTRHTLVPGDSRPIAGRSWVTTSPRPRVSTGHIRLLDHVAMCVPGGTLTDHADYYTYAFGLPRYSSEYIDLGDQAMDSIVVRSPSGGVTFTILEQDPDRKPGQVEGFVSRYDGPGVQHLAFLVDDIISSVHEFAADGVSFLDTPEAYYDILSERLPGIRDEIAGLRAARVLACRDEWGYLLQLFTRSPHKRNTMFYELVQRRGARGFGSANIKALYEAVERDGLAAG